MARARGGSEGRETKREREREKKRRRRGNRRRKRERKRERGGREQMRVWRGEGGRGGGGRERERERAKEEKGAARDREKSVCVVLFRCRGVEHNTLDSSPPVLGGMCRQNVTVCNSRHPLLLDPEHWSLGSFKNSIMLELLWHNRICRVLGALGCGLVHSCSSDLILSQGAPYALGRPSPPQNSKCLWSGLLKS